MQVSGYSALRAKIKPGPVNADTTDEEVHARATLTSHDLAVPLQLLEHLFKLERRIFRLENPAKP